MTRLLSLILDVHSQATVSAILSDGKEIAREDLHDVEIPQAVARARTLWSSSWQFPREASNYLLKAAGTLPLPDAVSSRIRQEVARANALGEECILYVQCNDDTLVSLPWELLATQIRQPELLIVRAARPNVYRNYKFGEIGKRLLVIGSGEDPYVHAEVKSVSRIARAAGLELEILIDPTLGALSKCCSETQPTILHFAATAGWDPVRKELAIEGAGGNHYSHKELVDALSLGSTLKLVFLSTCDAGTLAARRITTAVPSASVLGWHGTVDSAHAADFATYFYRRLFEERRSPLNAIGHFRKSRPVPTDVLSCMTPTLWIAMNVSPHEATVPAPPRSDKAHELSVSSTPLDQSARNGGGGRADQPGPVWFSEFEIRPICPALLKSGVSPVERIVIASQDQPITIELVIECDTGAGRSDWHETLRLVAEDTTVPAARINFPILHELISHGVERRQINLTASLMDGQNVLARLTRPVLFMGPTEWLDAPQTLPYLASYVLSDSDSVKTIRGHAERVLRILSGDRDADFTGYDPGQTVDLQVQAIYQAIQTDFDLRYSPPPGGDVFTTVEDSDAPSGDRSEGQRVRFPDEVCKHRRGTCHDLSLLMASCAEQIRVHPLLVLTYGHTMWGYWRDGTDHKDFWRERRSDNTRHPTIGGHWTIHELPTLVKLMESDKIQIVEAMELTGKKSEFERACKMAASSVGRGFQSAVDVRASRRWVEPVYRPPQPWRGGD